MERYLRVNLLGPDPRLMKKNLPGRGLTKVEKHWYKAPTILPAGDQHEVELVPPHPEHQQASSSVLYTTSCKHSLMLLRVGEIIARNMLI